MLFGYRLQEWSQESEPLGPGKRGNFGIRILESLNFPKKKRNRGERTTQVWLFGSFWHVLWQTI